MALGMTKAVSPVPNHLNGHFEPVALANYLVQVDKYCDLFADQQTSPVNSQWDLVRGQYEANLKGTFKFGILFAQNLECAN
jgi:hypothetical protein